jgi:hypothetical protein
MAVRTAAGGAGAKVKVTFVLPDDVHSGPVSVVGDFNDWRPGAHRLVKRSNGTRSVSAEVPGGRTVRFRYLGSGGRWFDDPDLGEVDESGTLLRV